MTRENVQIIPGVSLLSRPAAAFVRAACEFSCSIMIFDGEKSVNAKSMMGVLSLGKPKESTLVLEADGEDEQQAVIRLLPLLKRLFND